MKPIILILSLLFAFPAFAGDRVIINPEQDGDLKLKVNDGGVVTDVVTVDGATSRFGVGTDTPVYLFEVSKSTPGDWLARVFNTSTTGHGMQVTTAASTVSEEAFKVRTNTTTDSLLVYGNGAVAFGADTGDPRIDPTSGSAGSPSYGFGGDTDTGMYRSAANEVTIATGATARATINEDVTLSRSLVVSTTGAVLARGDSGSTELGFFTGTNGGSATTDTCTTICNGDRGGHGMSVSTGAYCVTGFGEAGGGVLTCADATALAKLCVCFGRRN